VRGSTLAADDGERRRITRIEAEPRGEIGELAPAAMAKRIACEAHRLRGFSVDPAGAIESDADAEFEEGSP
jgi:hypothetical protein